ncbi:MAG TPA: hypothetical protein PK156_48915 [Polyangium sp.]|nr:hypothetical protein [Polyangium sp.]
MDNKVGDNGLTAQEVAELLTQAKAISNKLKAHGIALTTDDRKRLLHGRRGASEHIQRVVDLATKYGVSLANVPLGGIANDLKLEQQLQPIEEELRVALQIAEDTGAQASSESWEGFLAYYGVLSSMAQRMPDVAADLASVVEFMAQGPRKKSPPKAP